jgi:hypothetical protein
MDRFPSRDSDRGKGFEATDKRNSGLLWWELLNVNGEDAEK